MSRVALISILGLIILSEHVHAQTFSYAYFNQQDSTYYSSLLILPQKDSIKGLVVRDYTSLPDTTTWKPNGFAQKCLHSGYAYLITNSSNYFPELCYSDTVLHRIDTMVHHALSAHSIPKQNVFVGGISASGTRAFKYAGFCEKGMSHFDIKIAGIFGVDPPLDLVRFYQAVHHSDSFMAGMAEEAVLKDRVFEEKMGNPKDDWIKYYETSVFTHQHFTGGNAHDYLRIPIILFHEPDLDWWWQERGARYSDINSIDIDRFYDYLTDLGKSNMEVVATSEKGYDKHGNRKCHSWSIIDEEYLIEWILKHSQFD